MNYIQEFTARLTEKLPDQDPVLIKYYVLLGLVKGKDVTLRDVHDGWAMWRNESNPEHKSLIHFTKLTREVQDYDEPYRKAIADTAEELGY